METTRLIDANALFHVVAGHHDLYKGATLRTDKARRDELLQVMVDINEAPTVDAIPVEWLKQKSLEGNDPFNPYMMVMYAWFKENQAYTEKRAKEE